MDVRIPKKYKAAVREFYRDSDGYWIMLNPGYVWGVDETTVVNGENYKQIMEAMAEVKRINKPTGQGGNER